MSSLEKPKNPNLQSPTQEMFDEVVLKYKANSGYKGVREHPGNHRMAYRFKPTPVGYIQGNTAEAEESTDGEYEFMLASCSKVAINIAEAELLLQLEQIPVSGDLLGELLFELLRREPHTLSGLDLTEELKENIANRVSLLEAMEAAERGKYLDQGKDDFVKLFREETLSFTPAELIRQSLKISSNTATYIIKQLVSQSDLQQRLDDLNLDYEASNDTINMQHWFQDRPNVGKLSPHARLLHNLVDGQVLSPEVSESITEPIKNNTTGFDFDFTTTDLGTGLIAEGYNIYEKTGYYPCVMYPRGLAEDGFPPHMVMATIFTVESPDGELHTFYHHLLVEVSVPVPTWNPVAPNGQVLVFPNEFDPAYTKYADQVKLRFADIFRAELEEKVRAKLLR